MHAFIIKRSIETKFFFLGLPDLSLAVVQELIMKIYFPFYMFYVILYNFNICKQIFLRPEKLFAGSFNNEVCHL